MHLSIDHTINLLASNNSMKLSTNLSVKLIDIEHYESMKQQITQ